MRRSAWTTKESASSARIPLFLRRTRKTGFFLELVPQGELTPKLYNLKKGDTMLCRKIAKGRFTLDLRSGRTNHLSIGNGDRSRALVSYVRTLYKDWKAGNSPMPGITSSTAYRAQPLLGFGYREEMERYASEVPG